MLRAILTLSLVTATTWALSAHDAQAQTQREPVVFTVAPLPYASDALEPAIDSRTMQIHHSKHHAAYVDNLNKEVAATPALKDATLEDIIAHVSKYSPAVRNNAGGHWNHTFFWNIMAPEDKAGAPSEALAKAIVSAFGSMDEFKAAFEKAGTSRFGSGWVWLVVRDGKLEITSTPNQDNPLMDDAPVKGAPVLGNDVWEHAYYLKYHNKRGDYLKNWWRVVNWAKASEIYEAALAAPAQE